MREIQGPSQGTGICKVPLVGTGQCGSFSLILKEYAVLHYGFISQFHMRL